MINRTIIALICVMTLFFSCRKVKMKDEKKVLIGDWILFESCGAPNGCIGISPLAGEIVKIEKNGDITLFVRGSTQAEGRIKRMKLTDDPLLPNPVTPQVNYYYEIEIKKLCRKSNADQLIPLNRLRYSNGYFDSSSNFIVFEQIFLIKKTGDVIDWYWTLKRN
jgi:hypothetical protein